MKQVYFSKEKSIWASLMLVSLVMIILAFVANGTADDGDSVHHYLYARYAFQHPFNFFNHWAKPLFVMISAPFAQFGFTGMKLLNIAFLIIQLYCTIKIGEHFNIKRLWLIPIFALAAPMNVTHTLSGLTEPMFAAWFAVSTLLLLKNRTALAYMMFSFLPFVRSEGLIILCPLLLFALWRRDYLFLPFFAFGHVFMAVAGKPIHGEYGWVFNKMTYGVMESTYGHGSWDHFIINMPFIIGSTLCGLLILGLVGGFFRLIGNGKWFTDQYARDEAWVVYGMFLSYFAAHTIFWWKGMFNSFGMLRVILGIMPSILLICLNGVNILADLANSFFPKAKKVGFAVLLILLCWSFDRQISWDQQFNLNRAQHAIDEASEAVLKKFPDKASNTYYVEAVYAALPLDLDIFDTHKTRAAWRLYSGEPIEPNSIVFWDEWFYAFEGRVPLLKLQNDKRLISMGAFDGKSTGGEGYKTHIFYVNPDSIRSPWYFEHRFDTLSESPKVIEIGGRKAVVVDKKHPYAPSFESGLKSFPKESTLVITFDGYSESENNNVAGTFVFAAEAGYRSYLWRGSALKGDHLPANTWNSFRYEEKLPKGIGDKDKIIMYVWNDSGNAVYIDNFKVTVK